MAVLPNTITATRQLVLNRLAELQRAVDALQVFHPRLDPDEALGELEGFLDLLAYWPSAKAHACAGCGEPLAEFRVNYYQPRPDSDPGAVEELCVCCANQREVV